MPSIRRPSQADHGSLEQSSIDLEIEDEPSGVTGDPLARIEQRVRTQKRTLDAIQGGIAGLASKTDLDAHAKSDRDGFVEVKESLTSLQTSTQAAIGEIKGQIGEVSGSVKTILALQDRQAQAEERKAAAAEALALAAQEARKTEIAATQEVKKAEITERTKLEIARTNRTATVLIKIVAAIVALGGIVTAAMVGRATAPTAAPIVQPAVVPK